MSTAKIALFAGAAVVIAGGLVVAIRMNPSTSTKDGQGTIAAPVTAVVPNPAMSQREELNPFTHVASIPATVDPSTIRFEKLKAVELASKVKTSEAKNCGDKQFRDPDGSNCQTLTVEERVKAVEAQYSYNGPEIATGETTPGRTTFSVYFRPEEVDVDGPVGKLKRDQAASLFQISTARPLVQQRIVDKKNSRFCEGNYHDGNWVQTDPNCKDQVQYITETVPSSNWTIQVDVRHPAAMASR